MALVDQRILIPAPMNVVWEVIADHRQLAKWRRDCKTYSLLSTHHVGVGVRRRVSPPKGKDFIEEFMAWYNNFGYEYKLVDNNKDYKHHLSRIRLQATPEGTIVQWTIEYQVKGFWVNLLGKRRRQYRLERMVVDSLRDLRRHVQSMGVLIGDDYRTKASVQDAPDAEKR